MATKNTAVRDAQADNMASLFNRLDLRTSGGATTLATFTITWGSSSTGTVGVSNTPLEDDGLADGTAVEARLYNSTPGPEISGLTVGTVGTEDIVLDNNVITTGQLVRITAFSFTEPAATA